MYFVEHGHSHEVMYRNSPFYEVQTRGTSVRWQAGASKPQKHYPIYDDLEQRGASDYLAIKIPLQAPFEAGFSFSTDAPDGFPEGFEDLLAQLSPLIGLVLSFGLERLSLSEILKAYLGKGPARRVLGGQMRRGQIDRVVSVIGFANLSGYREQVGGIDDDHQNQLLDHFFKQIYQAITPLGGEILKFIGETVLFVFPYDDERADECCQAALQGTKSLLAAPQLGVKHGDLRFSTQAALHVGEVSSGNIGSEGRLDFTIMGHAVNLTARLHQLVNTRDERLILSSDFASISDQRVKALGTFQLKGVDHLQEAFTPYD
jgi:adenylate cyclase